MIRMPVHLAYDRRTLIEKELDRFVDSKGCLQASRTLHRLEPVCCCERCYACLANPLIEQLTEQDWSNDQAFAGQDDGGGVLLADPEWFSRYPFSSSCSCEFCLNDFRMLCRKNEEDLSQPAAIAHNSPPFNKKRMTSNSSAEGKFLCPRYSRGRRPLVDLQWGAVVADEDDGLKRPDPYDAKRSSWSRDCHETSSRDETHSWVQPPPNRTICHIVNDVILERLASSSPMLTHCCITSRKHGSSRQAGKTKAKNQSISR